MLKVQIIGGGYVVFNRMLPALLHLDPDLNANVFSHDSPYGVAEFNKAFPSVNVDFFGTLTEFDAEQSIIERLGNETTIIAIPPYRIPFYLKSLARSPIRLIVEKPFCSARHAFEEITNDLLLVGKTFFLSYYALEKALGWTYIHTTLKAHRELLCISPNIEDISDKKEFSKRLGALARLEVYLLEGEERSPRGTTLAWFETHPFGVLLDMGVHALSIVSKAIPLHSLSINSVRSTKSRDRSNILKQLGLAPPPSGWMIDATTGVCSIKIAVGKHIEQKQKQRCIRAEYEHAHVYCDLDTCNMRINWKSGETSTVSTCPAEGYRKYYAQMTLCKKFIEAGWDGGRFDDYTDQVKSLHFLFDNIIGDVPQYPINSVAASNS